jgi:hypothetical protein
MSIYEIISVAIATLSAAIACWALFISRRVERAQQEQGKLAAAQLKQLARDQHANLRADLRATLIDAGGRQRFVLENVGTSIARNVRVAPGRADLKLPVFDLELRFPVAELRRGECVELIAAITKDMEFPVPIIITWDDDAGQAQQRLVALNPSSR